ncbi:hypothetical protein niasHT_010427 [Heterodera trifolii]|uniref:Uncharacterized protein n=1 Tax=Heterodera trifolii TaxID=157864 RepID=A0ABD2MAU6_9BILA
MQFYASHAILRVSWYFTRPSHLRVPCISRVPWIFTRPMQFYASRAILHAPWHYTRPSHFTRPMYFTRPMAFYAYFTFYASHGILRVPSFLRVPCHFTRLMALANSKKFSNNFLARRSSLRRCQREDLETVAQPSSFEKIGEWTPNLRGSWPPFYELAERDKNSADPPTHH